MGSPSGHSRPDSAETAEVDAPKLIRLGRALRALLEETDNVPPNPSEEDYLIRLVPKVLAEVGSSLPEPLLQELGGFVSPSMATELTASSARLVLAQLCGWVTALAAEAFALLGSGPMEPPAEVTDQVEEPVEVDGVAPPEGLRREEAPVIPVPKP